MLAGLHRPAAHSLLSSALHVAVHLHRSPGGTRHISDVAVLERGDADLVRAVPALHWDGGTAAVRPGAGAALLRELLEHRDVAAPIALVLG